MIKDIKYSGYSAVPSDYECQDGTLAQSVNLINENGSLSSILPPKVKLSLGKEYKVLLIHETSAMKHYIVQNTTTSMLYWIDAQSTDNKLTELEALKSLISVSAVGNTIVILYDGGMKYWLWKTDSYIFLGTHLPECPISFGLQGEFVTGDEFEIEYDEITWSGDNSLTTSTDPYCALFTDDNKTKITNQVLAKVNKFIADESTAKGKFIFPFFVRCAYRLYDGTLTMHSMPVLMIASSDVVPEAAVTNVSNPKSSKTATQAKIKLMALLHELDYAVILESRLEELKNWNDIVSSVDIFVSAPIYTYDQNGECTRFAVSQDSDSYSVCKMTNQTADTSTYPVRYQKIPMHWAYAMATNNVSTIYRYRLMLPYKSKDAVKESIRNTGTFYFLKSIKLDDLKTERTVIKVEEDYLQSLVTREVMTDDYDSHDVLYPKYQFGYNGRINLANIQKELYNLYNAGAQFPYTDGYVYGTSYPTMLDNKYSYIVYFHIKQDGKDIIVRGESFALGYNMPKLFLFYPNINAYKATIICANYFSTVYEVPLEQHSLLNGSFYFDGWEEPETKGSTPSASTKDGRMISVLNKIYTSEVNNPFVFPVTNINTVGTGKILGISSAAKALSQGQFGQFPLYAFSDEGVWALEVSSTGGYTAKQPITRDVVLGTGASITQIDSAVLFATDRGIMLISGSQSQCITDSIDNITEQSVLHLNGSKQLLSLAAVTEKETTIVPFKTFIVDCRMTYDYVNQRIIVFNEAYPYAYVFSLKSKQWGMMQSSITSTVNSYPEALAMDSAGNLVDFSSSDVTENKGFLLTRPIKLEMPDVLKTMDTIIQRGNFAKGHVQSALYGSRDLINWHLVWSSKDHYLRGFRGTPYKYFRIACVTSLAEGESIYGASLQFNARQTDQPR